MSGHQVDHFGGSSGIADVLITIISFILRGIGSLPLLGFLNPLADWLGRNPWSRPSRGSLRSRS